MNKKIKVIKEKMWIKILLAMFLGFVIGFILTPEFGIFENEVSNLIANYISIPGYAFLSLIQMIVIPLVISSIITGIASNGNFEQLKVLGLRLFAYFVMTTSIAIVIGLSVATLVGPGNFVDTAKQSNGIELEVTEASAVSLETIPDAILSLIPSNPLGAMVEREMLGVVIFSIIIGIALIVMPSKQSKPLVSLMDSLQATCLTIVKWIMKIAPLAVFGLLAQVVVELGFDALFGMGVYVLTVLLGLLTMVLVYLLIIKFYVKKNPLEFLKAARDAQLLAFSTSSSAAAMPLSLETAEFKLGVRPAIVKFLIPLGTTVNMDGTALYQAVATIFLAQVFNVELSILALLIVLLTTLGASIGSPATPGVGIVILSMVLTSVGIPAAGVAMILGVDRILDMSRTAVNVTGDLTASLVMEKAVGNKNIFKNIVTD